MSKILEIISLCPPRYVEDINRKESLLSSGHPCGYCNGNGFFWREDTHERVKTPCPLCGGCGKLDALVSIEWKSSKPIIEHETSKI